MTGTDRLTALGILPDNNTWRGRVSPNAMSAQDIHLFQARENGDIEINYLSLDGDLAIYDHGTAQTRPYQAIRLAQPITGEDGKQRKYLRPKGQGSRPYLTPGIIEACRDEQEVHTLVLIEGEFKAYAGHLAGLHIIGGSGIHNFHDLGEDKKRRIYVEIATVIERCKVRNVLILFDADVRQVRYEEGKDLFTRPNNFFNAIKNLRESLKEYKVDTYFGHLEWGKMRSFEFGEDGQPKGLDDLLTALPDRKADIIEQLLKLTSVERYFETQNVSTTPLKAIKTYFFIDSALQFYGRYSEHLGDKVFRFMGDYWQWDSEKAELQQVKAGDIELYLRVGTSYYKRSRNVDAKGNWYDVMLLWEKGAISTDFVDSKKDVKVFQKIEKYDSFCNVPDHTNHKAVHGNNYNLYFPLKHMPDKGDINSTLMYLRHLFENEHQQCFDMALDYLTLLYRVPTQRLPILCLVSEEKGTGKSTFLFWLREMFGENAIVATSRDLVDRFNGHWATKLVIGVDEGFIEKKETLERLKSMSTETKILMENKHKGRIEVDFFGKFVITSNDEKTFLKIDDREKRFWICKVPKFTGQEDPDLMDKLIDEIPAFLLYLRERQMIYPKATRMYFSDALYNTKARQELVLAARDWLEQSIQDVITDVLLEHGLREVTLGRKEIIDLLQKKGQRNNVELPRINRVLLDIWKLKETNGSYDVPHLEHGGMDSEWYTKWVKERGRYFRFEAAQIMAPQHLELLAESLAGAGEQSPRVDVSAPPVPEPESLPF